MKTFLVVLLGGLAVAGCEQNIGGNGGLAGTDRPSIVAACSQALASEPKRRDRDPVVVNLPAPEPSIRCSKGAAGEE